MPTRFFQYSFCLIMLGLLLSPGLVYAHEGPGIAPHPHPQTGPFGDFDTSFGPLTGSIDDKATSGQTPIIDFLDTVIKIVRGVVVALGLIFVVLGGYRYMTAGGDSDKVKTAKTIILAGLGGILLAIVGQVILDTISPQFSSDLTEPKLEIPTN